MSLISDVFHHPFPVMLVYFVTARCNARCKMCFYSTNTSGAQELDLREVERVSKSLPHLRWLLLSGGEPFLRPDLGDLCETFLRNSNVDYLQIPTNGSLPDVIVGATERLVALPFCRQLVISVSLDHIGPKHDEIRQVKGLFSKATETIRALRQVSRTHKNLGVTVNVTCSTYNAEDLDSIIDYLDSNFDVDGLNLTLVRGNTPQPVAPPEVLRAYKRAYLRLLRDTRRYRYYHWPKKILAYGKDYLQFRLIVNAAEKNKYTLPCRAARNVAVMSETGQLYPCELRDDGLGNIRDFDYDMKKAWSSPAIRQARRQIALEKCFCTYECAMGPNLLFNPLWLPFAIGAGLVEWIRASLHHRGNPLAHRGT
ncbi:MAG: radical SAM protein [Chloroflexota bacterium]